MMRSVDARMTILGGTFRPDNYDSSGRYCASTEFTPEIAEEEAEEQLRDPLRGGFVSIEEIADPEADILFLHISGEIEDEEV